MALAYPQANETPQDRASTLSPSGGSYTVDAGRTADGASQRQAEFSVGMTSHGLGSASLAQMQDQYAAIVPRRFSAAEQGAGVLAKTENVPSNLTAGGRGADQTSVYAGQRWTQTSPVGRSASTIASSPQFKQQSASLQPAQYGRRSGQ